MKSMFVFRGRSVTILLLITLLLGSIPTFIPSVSAVVVSPGTYFTTYGGLRNYTVHHIMNFSSITIDTNYVIFNTTGIIPYLGTTTYITLRRIDDDPLTTILGDKVIEFDYAFTGASNYFEINGLKNSYNYRVTRNSVNWSYLTSDATGAISFTTTISGTITIAVYDYGSIPDTTNPSITLNFAGNHSDKGGPYYCPPGETIALSGANLNGYYTNNSYQNESWIYINTTITDNVGVSYTRLHWHNETTGTWYNITGLVKRNTNYYDYNTSINITNISIGHKYSFDIYAYDAAGNTMKAWWNKTDIGNDITRRYVYLKNQYASIAYKPLYFYNINYTFTTDGTTRDRLQKDQGTDGGPLGIDTAYLTTTTPTNTVNYRTCSAFVGGWFNNNSCVTPFALTNVYYHLWERSSNYAYMEHYYGKSRINLLSHPGSLFNRDDDSSSDNKSNVVYDGDTYRLISKIGLRTIGDYNFTDNNIPEFYFGFEGSTPELINNRSFTSFILINVPSNATLNATYGDSDHDNLSDWQELYYSFTNPFLQDTDADGYNDTVEYYGGTDPNDYLNYTGTSYSVPSVLTNESTSVEETTATLNGFLTDDGGGALTSTYTIIRPNDDGTYHQLSDPFPADEHYVEVNEIIPNDSHYLYTLSTTFKTDTFYIENISSTGNINNISLNNYYQLGSSALGSQVKGIIRTHGINYEGTLHTLPIGNILYQDIWFVNPFTGVAWTLDEINNLEAGAMLIKIGSGFPILYCLNVTVNYDTIGTIVNFQYGTTTSYGTETTEQYKISGDIFSQTISSLSQGALYHFRAKATNDLGQSYGIDRSFVTKPESPTSLTITNTGTNNIQSLTWAHGSGYNKTVIRAKADGPYPANPQSDTSIYNASGTSTTVNNTFLLPGRLYYYRAWEYANWGILHQFSDSYTSTIGLTKPYAPTNTYLNRTGFTTANLSWINGDGANRTIIRYKSTGFPLNALDGLLIYNGTGTYCPITLINGTVYYFSAFSFTIYPGIKSTYSDNGTGFTNIGGTVGGFIIYAFDQYTGADITFNVLITNQAGTPPIYYETGCTNPTLINASLCPNGEDIQIIINATGYRPVTYLLNIYPGIIYTLNAYLPPINIPGGEPEENYSRIYRVRVINEYTAPIPDAFVTVKKYINITGTFEDVGNFYTNGYGEGDIWLMPSTYYKVFITKTGYEDVVGADWLTDPTFWGANYPKIFQMTTITETDLLFENIVWSMEPEETGFNHSFTVYYNISSSDNQLQWFNAEVSRYNVSDESWILLYSDNQTLSMGGTMSYTIANITGVYRFTCGFKKTDFDYYTLPIIYYSIYNDSVTLNDLDDIITHILGKSPVFIIGPTGETIISWTALIASFIAIFVLFGFSQKFSGLAIIAVGAILGICKGPLGIIQNDILNWTACGIIIILGIILIISDKKEEKAV